MDPALAETFALLRAAPRQSGIFVDFDGTLSPIVDNPADARPVDGAPRVLQALAEKFGVVVVVSGRPVDFLLEKLDGASHVRLRGLYGLQQWRNGAVVEDPRATKWRAIVSEGATTAEAQLPKGVHVERKGMSFVLHYRRAPELGTVAEEWAVRFANSSGLDAQRARQAVEIGPFVNVDKGAVVRELSDGLSAVAVFGDDAGDIPMFHAAKEKRYSGLFSSVNVCVSTEETPQPLLDLADVTVSSPHEVLEVLRLLLD